MKFSIALSVFLAAVARAGQHDDMHAVARGLQTSEDGIFHVGRDGVLRSFSRDLEVLDAAPLRREAALSQRDLDASIDAFTVSKRDMFNPAEDIVKEARDLRAIGAKKVARSNLQKRCGSWCTTHGSCALNEQACQGCYSNRCGYL